MGGWSVSCGWARVGWRLGVALCCGPVRLALPIGPSPRLRVPAFRHLKRGRGAMGHPWPNAPDPASCRDRPLFRCRNAACWRGGRTGPQQRTSRNLSAPQKELFLSNNTNITVLLSSRPWGRGPLPAGRVEVRLRRDGRHGCRPSPVGPWKAHRGVPCASVPERGNPERQRGANGGGQRPQGRLESRTPAIQ